MLPSLFLTDSLGIPDWAAQNGSSYHIQRINALLPGSVMVIRDYFRKLNVSANTKATYLIAVKAAVRDHYGEKFYTDFALRSAIDFFFESIMPKRDRHTKANLLDEGLIQKLINESGLKSSLWIQNLYTIGRRVSELCSLRWDQVRMESADLAIAQVPAKGGWIDAFRIPLSLLELNRSIFRGKTFVLESKEGRRTTRQNVLLLCHNAGKNVLGYPVHPHTFRHSFASHQMQRNPGKLKAIMDQGGWKNAREFIETYGHDVMDASDFRMMPQASPLQRSDTALLKGLDAPDFFSNAG